MFIGAMLLAGMMMVSTPVDAQTRKQKKEIKQKELKAKELERQCQLDSLMNRFSESLEHLSEEEKSPCYKESRSDKDYYRELGEGISTDQYDSHIEAVRQAQINMMERLTRVAKELSSEYSKKDTTTNMDYTIIQLMENEMINAVTSFYTEIPCEKVALDAGGIIHTYLVIETSKKDIVNTVTNTIRNNEKLRDIFDSELFRKIAEDYMGMQEE